jgi:hypothetical protein
LLQHYIGEGIALGRYDNITRINILDSFFAQFAAFFIIHAGAPVSGF